MESAIGTYIWPSRLCLGSGASGLLGHELNTLHSRRAFVIVDPGVAAAGLLDVLAAPLKAAGHAYLVYDKVAEHPDITSISQAVDAFHECGADTIVAVGGGSAIDTGKAVRLVAGGPKDASVALYSSDAPESLPLPSIKRMPPLVAVPTTAGTGSEVTPWTIVSDRKAQTQFGLKGGASTVPTVALADPELTLSLPPRQTAATGMDALSHCVEAYVSTNRHPLLDPLLLDGIRRIGRSLRQAVAHDSYRNARLDMMTASVIGGIGITANWLGACHALAHPLSALAGLQRGMANAIMLPHQMAFSLSGALERYADIADALDAPYPLCGTLVQKAQRAVAAVRELTTDIALPCCLKDIGIREDQLSDLADAAFHDTHWHSNPKRIDRSDMLGLLQQAFSSWQ